MRVSANQVVLDTDFINGITAYQDGDAADLFRRVFQELGQSPIVHSFVAEQELVHNDIAQALLREGYITSISLTAMCLPDGMDGKVQYRKNFEAMYERIERKAFPDDIKDIFGRHAGMSFGEIHSILLATELGIPLLYSNDGGTKRASKYYAKGRLTVMNAEELGESLKGSVNITSKERKFIRNIYRR